jgi:hypothetical protein
MLFDSCQADEACNATYPNLHDVFFDTVDKLNENPVRVNSLNSFTGEIYKNVLLNGNALIGIIFQLLYDSNAIPTLPRLIYQAAEGDYNLYGIIIGALISQQEVVSNGMNFAVQCQEEISFVGSDELTEAWAKYPEYIAFGNSNLADDVMVELCTAFPGTSPAIENEAISSNIPTLVTAGQFDPITPPAWAEHAAETLANSRYIEFPYSGHGATGSVDCPKEITVAFFLNPEPNELDTSCIDDMSITYTGTVETQVDFIPISLFDYSIPAETVVPAGWEEQSTLLPGMFARMETSLDTTALMFLRIPLLQDAELAARALQSQFGIELETVTLHESNSVEWHIYPIHAQGVPGYIAITTDDLGGIL